ncbi:MAG: type II secretion system protein [Lachnospiraceae bacterium]|nr:type II secretion system protein [Lachnospiraceae bacterium]
MKKMNNKGFSLVELIIVIAIMAILAGAIAPALIRYIDKSRRSNDVSAAKTIKTAVETAMANENTYELLTTGATNTVGFEGDTASTSYNGMLTVDGGGVTTAGGAGITVDLKGSVKNGGTDITATAESEAKVEIGKNIGEKTPKIKFKKDPKGANGSVPTDFVVYCTAGGNVVVGVKAGTTVYQLAPEVSKYYQ